ncbi:hypothetical protein NHJ13051_007253 [Beauveria bassiana]
MSMHSLEFYEKLMDIDAQQAKIHSMPIRVLWQKIFINTLFEIKSSTESQWYWIIDALDEADMPSELISLIGRINSQTPINMLITSRVDMDIKRSLQTSATESRLERQSVHGKYRGWPWGVAFDKDATKVSLAYKEWPIEVWYVDRVEIVESVPTGNPLGSCFNPSNNDIYVMDHDSAMIRYDVQAQTATQIRLDVRVAVCNPSGTLLVTGDSSGVLKFFAADTMELLYKIGKYSDMITGLCFSPDGTKLYDIRASDCNVWIPEVLLVSVREDSSLSGVEPENSTLSRTGSNITGDSSSLVLEWSADGSTLVSIGSSQRFIHPHLSEQIISLDLQVARILSWDTFETLTSTDGIVLDHDLAVDWAEKKVKTLAHLTHDKRSVVVEWSTLERNPATKCSTWSSLGFATTAELIQELDNWHHLRLDSVVGVYRNQAVFLDQDLWVCSSPCGKKTGTTRHFYMPMDWLNTSEERLAVMARSGELVYAQRGVVVVVRCGMRSNQGLV